MSYNLQSILNDMDQNQFGLTTEEIIKGVFHRRRHVKPALCVKLIARLNHMLIGLMSPPGTVV